MVHLIKQIIQKFIETGNIDYIYKNDLDKACFQHDKAYCKYKDLTEWTQSDKVLRGKAFETASKPEYDWYQRGLASMVCKFFNQKSKGSGIKSMPNQQLANDLHKSITRQFKRERFILCLKTTFGLLI